MQNELATTCNKNAQQHDAPRVLLNYWPNGRRWLWIHWQRLLDETETGLSRSNCDGWRWWWWWWW